MIITELFRAEIINLILLSLSLGITLPLIGVFTVLRKEALLSDALAHVILLGIALSIIFKINILLGIFAFSILAGLAIYLVKNKSSLELDAVVGVFFTTALTLGALLISSEELLESFLGNLEKITRPDVIISTVLAAVLIFALFYKFKEFASASFAPDLAQVDGLKVQRYELFFMLMLALAVAMGIKLVGTLLISALIIVPAATAKIFTMQLRTMALWSVIFGVAAVFAGLTATLYWGTPPGPTIILSGSGLFFLTLIGHLLFKKHK